MNIPSIPRELLCHSCTLEVYGRDGIFGERLLLSKTSISGVRISHYRDYRSSVSGEVYPYGGVMYYDCQNSSPENISFMGNDTVGVIIFGGLEYRILGIKYIYAENNLHHLEIELGGVSCC